jgi:hypothetical protein
LSYTEVLCTSLKLSMVHTVGNPCNPRENHAIEMRRLYSSISTERKGIKDSHA